MYQNVLYPIYDSLLIDPNLIPFWSVPDRQTDRENSSPLVPLVLFFTERMGPYLQAQLYWAGQTIGWMAD